MLYKTKVKICELEDGFLKNIQLSYTEKLKKKKRQSKVLETC